MAPARSRALRPLLALLREQRPDVEEPERAVAEGRVLVDGRFVTNPAARVPAGCALVVRPGDTDTLRGEAKLGFALEHFGVASALAGRVALDAGASAGGFTRVLLAAGVARVYAVEAGVGQLVGSLRQDPRVVNLEGTNLGDLSAASVPEVIDIVTLDLSYLSLTQAVPQLDGRVSLAPGADLVALVKPMFELHRATAPTDEASVALAIEVAAEGVAAAGWRVVATTASPVAGARGAREGWLHARRG